MSEPQGTPMERAILASVNALAENQREHAIDIRELKRDVSELKLGQETLKQGMTSLNGRMNDLTRSTAENFAEVKDLLVRALDR